MRAICLRYCRNNFDAEDILQEGFIKVFTSIEQFKWKGSFEGWMRRIFIGCAVNYLKEKEFNMFRKSLEIDPSKEGDFEEGDQELFFKSGDFEMEEKLSIETLVDILQKLPVGYRLIFNLYAIEEYTHKEISRMLNISTGTSKSQLSKARKYLQAHLYDHVQELKKKADEDEDRLLKIVI